jgi:hypothetical protein
MVFAIGGSKTLYNIGDGKIVAPCSITFYTRNTCVFAVLFDVT